MPPKHRAPKRAWWRQMPVTEFLSPNAKFRPGEVVIPNWMTTKSIVFFFLALFGCWFVFGHVPSFDLAMSACVSVILFFYGGHMMAKNYARTKEKSFLKYVYLYGLIVRLLWVFYMFFIFNPNHYGTTFGDGADVTWYMPFGADIAEWIKGNKSVSFEALRHYWASAVDDVGYPFWLAIGYLVWGEYSDVFMPMIVKCIVGAYCAISIYRIAKRHFGEETARMAAIFVCLNPNMIYWCGSMMKEAEMVFLCCLAVDNFDRVLSSGKKYTFKNLLPGILAGLSLMFFRSALGIVFFLAVFAHIVMASNRIMSIGKKIIAGIMVAAVLVVGMGDSLRTRAEGIVSSVQSDEQDVNMEWRANRSGGNSFARYASKTVFAPLIFTIPFPTFNMANEGQFLQVQLSGGAFIKNVSSFFVIMVMFMFLFSGEWRKHVFIIAYTVGYLVCLVLSNFAQSGRFHMPIWPMLMLFAAYGTQIVSITPRLKKIFPLVLVAEFFICIAWNWFKLKGRGMI